MPLLMIVMRGIVVTISSISSYNKDEIMKFDVIQAISLEKSHR